MKKFFILITLLSLSLVSCEFFEESLENDSAIHDDHDDHDD
jgi:hypothetical protein